MNAARHVLIAALLVASSVSAQNSYSDQTHWDPIYGVCNLARADYLGRHETVAIRTKPSDQSPKIGELRRGEIVYTCDDTGAGGGWYEIFDKDKAHVCGPVIKDGPVWKQGLPGENARTCASGWVPRKYINILSG